MEKESVTVEYKREYSESIKKTIIAFANTYGGKITVGIDDLGDVIGIEDTDCLILQIASSIREGIKPDVSMFTRYEHQEIDGKNIIVITVQKGTASPYYLANKGIRPEGVFVRQGASSVPASETAILNMIKNSASDNYEDTLSFNQELSFIALKNDFDEAQLKLENAQYKSLAILGKDNFYTNLALLLSDQCEHSIKLAIFEGTNKQIFKDRQEFSGSLLTQLKECFAFIDRHNKTRAVFDGLKRIDTRDYPISAIREALLNCIVHREYALNGSTLISMFDDRMEFVTLGGLVKGISKEDMLLGVSLLRNKNLAHIFYRLKLIEAYGTGIPKIMESYKGNVEPKIEITENAFKIILYNTVFINEKHESEFDSTNKISLTAGEQRVIQLFKNNKSIQRKDIENALNISQSMALKYLSHLQKKNVIEKSRSGKMLLYTLR